MQRLLNYIWPVDEPEYIEEIEEKEEKEDKPEVLNIKEDKHQPPTASAEIATLNKFDVFFTFVSDKEKINVENLEKLSADNNGLPILVCQENNIWVYGNTDGTDWRLTRLDD